MILCNLHPRCSISLLSLILMLSAFAVPAEDTDSEVSRHFLAGRQAQSSGNLNLAVQEYLAVVRLEPDLAEARVNLGLVYYLQNRYDASPGESRARVLSPESIRRSGPGFRESSLHKAWPERRESVSRYRLCEAGPGPAGRPVPESGRCAGAGQQGGPDLAGNRAVGFGAGDRGDSRAAQRGAGVSFQSRHSLLAGAGVPKCGERGDGARSGYCRDTTLPPSLRRYLQRRTVWDQARGHYRRALEKDPHWAGAHLGLGEIYFQQGKWDQARSEYLAEQATGAMTATASARLADIALLQGRPAEALRLLSEANQMRPDAAASALGLPALPFADNAPSGEEAKAGYRQSLRVLEKTPPAPARTLALAAVYLRLGLDHTADT